MVRCGGEHALFTSDQPSPQLILYHDDFNVVNPQGNKVVKYKSSAFCFVLGNIPSKLRSRLCDINLVMISPATLILQPFLKDLEKLETSGIRVVVEGRSIIFRGTLYMVIADNLSAHALGGFFCNFSTINHFCRYCDFSKVMLGNNFKSTEFVMCTKEGCQNNVSIIECDPDSASVYGLKSNSYLDSLTYFHVINGLPPDLALDVFEGVAVDVIFHVLINFVNEGVLTINEINDNIFNFTFSQTDLMNKPVPFKIISSQNFKFRQTACEMWNIIHLLPLMLGLNVPVGNEVWACLIHFAQVVEHLCANSVTHSDLVILESEIKSFFSEFIDLFTDVNQKRKRIF